MPLVLVEKQTPQITVVTLNRPERRNALTIELLTELTGAINVVSEEPHQRILILRGAGAAFCTGMDLKAATLRKPCSNSGKLDWFQLQPYMARQSPGARVSCRPAILS